ncbi:MAG: hypothetical protein IJ257_02235 [Treponema sp.]|nr:hypothetical protein [Treponema sp.]
MNKEICEKNMDKFMLLDKYERIPISVTLHLLKCRECRTKVHYLSLAEKYAAEPVKNSPLKTALENMQVKPVSMTKWIIWGIVMLFLMVTSGLFLNRTDRESFAIIFNVIFGLLITAYCAIFVGTNMDFFIKKIEKVQTA